MKIHLAIVVASAALLTSGCAETPAASPTSSTASAVPAATPEPPAPAAAPAPKDDGMTTSVTAVSNEITTPNVVTPDKVITALRPKLNACYQDGLKKNPKLEGSVTLSAKIEKDGTVSAVTPKNVTGLTPAVLKCLSDHLKAASFAAAGGMNYTTSIDIPVAFASH
jgi:hypothetical protein